ncbi:hypothetical protein [Streptomyces sp. NPDC021212]|uniref:hypothetical protein n=1 Tax=Streptomyces sp. NPDC021212 TaxID=3365118 RepID=UPI0037913596
MRRQARRGGGRRHGPAAGRRHRRARRRAQEAVAGRADEPYAGTLPAASGRTGRIVVPTAMLACLYASERRALIAHVHAHPAGRHHRYLPAQLAARANPLLRRLATERRARCGEWWADEEAASAVAGRSCPGRSARPRWSPAAPPPRRSPGSPRLDPSRAGWPCCWAPVPYARSRPPGTGRPPPRPRASPPGSPP